MRIREVWIRFYKSFNYDYELKLNPNSTKRGWQDTPNGWLPHICIDLEHDITAVVGANESGKSHLLDAIGIVLTGEGLFQRDFCRYSSLFSVENGLRLYPEVGATFELTEQDTATIGELNIPLLSNGDLLMLRTAPETTEVLDQDEGRLILDDDQSKGLQDLLPHAFQLKTQVDLPDSVSIAALAQTESPFSSRKKRIKILNLLTGMTSVEAVTGQAPGLFNLIGEPDGIESERQQLGRLLLTKVSRIEPSAFKDLQDAIADEREGLVSIQALCLILLLTMMATPFLLRESFPQ